ncbi:MAG: hypothetical protein V4506_15140 [Bacteroidota bacterium]
MKNQKLVPAAYVNKCIKKWGVQSQRNKIIEECLELALALQQTSCVTKDKKNNESNVYSELADVIIMMEQAKKIFDYERIKFNVKVKLRLLDEKYFNDEK